MKLQLRMEVSESTEPNMLNEISKTGQKFGGSNTNFVVGFGFRVNSRRHPFVFSLSAFQYAIGMGTARPTGLAFAPVTMR